MLLQKFGSRCVSVIFSLCFNFEDRAVAHGEVIAAKSEVTRLQAQLQSLETQQQELKLQHETKIDKLVQEHQVII